MGRERAQAALDVQYSLDIITLSCHLLCEAGSQNATAEFFFFSVPLLSTPLSFCYVA